MAKSEILEGIGCLSIEDRLEKDNSTIVIDLTAIVQEQ